MSNDSNRRRSTTKAARKAAGILAALAACATAGSAGAAIYSVNDTTDATDLNPGDGVCHSTAGTCTLRAAIVQANQSPGHDVIELPAGVYSMALAGASEDAAQTGDFDITDSLTIQGAGIISSIVDAEHLDRVFDIHPSAGSVAFESMTIRHGDVMPVEDPGDLPFDDAFRGGGIRALGDAVSLDGVLLTRNDALDGGGLAADNAVEIHRSRIHQNEASRDGGGVYTRSFDASMVFEDSVLWSNQAGVRGGGFDGTGDALFRRSAFFDNRAGHRGGGFHSNSGYTNDHAWNFENVTFAENQAVQGGGGIFVSGSFYAENVTIANNHAGGFGGGVTSTAIVVDDDLVHFRNSIIANNTAPSAPDCYGAIHPEGYNLVRDTNGCGWNTAPTDLPTGLDPLLAPLQFQQTHSFPISHSSPAKDASPDCPVEDQRGTARPQGTACDIGAYELVFDPEAPVAIDDDYDVPIPGPVTLTAPGVLANDVDPNGDALTAHLQYIDPSQGAVTLNPDGSFHFVPAGFYHATRTFTYYASDGAHDSNTAIVSVTSGFREPPRTVYEVPELPWLDPGPYRFDCIALWDDGTIATQAFGAGGWETPRFVAPRKSFESKTGSRYGGASTAFAGRLVGGAKQVYEIQGSFDDRFFEATVTGRDGRRVDVHGYESAACNVLADARDLRGAEAVREER